MYLKPQNGHVTSSTPKSFVAENGGQHQPPKDDGLVSVVLGNKKGKPHCRESSSLVAGRWPVAEAGSSELLSSVPSGKADATDAEDEVDDAAHRKTCSPAHQKGFSDRKEIEKRFETLSFAFKIESYTIEKRLNLLKRKRDQAEINVINEVGTLRNKLKELEHLASGVDADYYYALLDMNKELDYLLKAVSQLTSGAEGYGYVQHEKKILDFMAVMVQHVDNLEARRKETIKSWDGLPTESERFSEVSPTNLDDDGNDKKSYSNKSVGARASQQWSATAVPASTSTATAGATVPFEGHRRRRTSITAFPRTVPVSALSAVDIVHSCRVGFANDVDSEDESQSSMHGKRQVRMRPGKDRGKYSGRHETARIRKRTGRRSESPRNSICRKLFRETFQSIRSQVPGSRLNHFQSYLTWTTVFVLIFLTFLIGFCLGFQGYFVHSGSRCLIAWVAVLTFCVILQRFYRVLIGLFLASALLLVAFILWLGNPLPGTLTAEEIDRLLRAFGLELQVRYLNGPPPI